MSSSDPYFDYDRDRELASNWPEVTRIWFEELKKQNVSLEGFGRTIPVVGDTLDALHVWVGRPFRDDGSLWPRATAEAKPILRLDRPITKTQMAALGHKGAGKEFPRVPVSGLELARMYPAIQDRPELVCAAFIAHTMMGTWDVGLSARLFYARDLFHWAVEQLKAAEVDFWVSGYKRSGLPGEVGHHDKDVDTMDGLVRAIARSNASTIRDWVAVRFEPHVREGLGMRRVDPEELQKHGRRVESEISRLMWDGDSAFRRQVGEMPHEWKHQQRKVERERKAAREGELAKLLEQVVSEMPEGARPPLGDYGAHDPEAEYWCHWRLADMAVSLNVNEKDAKEEIKLIRWVSVCDEGYKPKVSIKVPLTKDGQLGPSPRARLEAWLAELAEVAEEYQDLVDAGEDPELRRPYGYQMHVLAAGVLRAQGLDLADLRIRYEVESNRVLQRPEWTNGAAGALIYSYGGRLTLTNASWPDDHAFVLLTSTPAFDDDDRTYVVYAPTGATPRKGMTLAKAVPEIDWQSAGDLRVMKVANKNGLLYLEVEQRCIAWENAVAEQAKEAEPAVG